MTPIANRKSEIANPDEPLPLSLLNDFLYCPRRAALKLVEGWREANVHTVRGELAHEHADFAGYEVVKGVKLLRALPVWSERLGLSGKCDIVEVEMGSAGGPPAPVGGSPNEIPANIGPDPQPLSRPMGEGGRRPGEGSSIRALRPVEFKLGKRRRFENDDAQLCAQALCLEEMLGVAVPRGAIFHADSKRRREVEFTPALRQLTEEAVAGLRALLGASEISNPESQISNLKSAIQPLPPAIFRPACEQCSLFDICLPKATSAANQVAQLARSLFEI